MIKMKGQSKYLFKVLDKDMRSFVNGSNQMKWELGKWYHEDEVKICKRGLHLTTRPDEWANSDSVICIAEAKGIADWQDDKCVCKDVRLLAKVSHDDWAE